MRVAIVQPVTGQIGGNDTMLSNEIDALKEHDLTLLTFSKPSKDYSIPVQTKVPFKMPIFGIYQRLFMPRFDCSKFDVILSNGQMIHFNKPTIIYDQNQMASDYSRLLPEKYSNGLWRLYVLPYKMLKKLSRPNRDARYYSCSKYSADALHDAIGVSVGTLYPGIDIECNSPEKKNQVCIMGRIAPEKNLEEAVQICNGVGLPYVIAGAVTTPNMPYLRRIMKMTNGKAKFMINPKRDNFLEVMEQSKIMLSASKETFGITTIEGIRQSCIPIVPDNSAHRETVPMTALRYHDIKDAIDKIFRIINNDTISGAVISRLQEHSMGFTKDTFSKTLNNIINETVLEDENNEVSVKWR